MDKWFHFTLYNRFNYLSMLGLKLIHVSGIGPWHLSNNVAFYSKEMCHIVNEIVGKDPVYEIIGKDSVYEIELNDTKVAIKHLKLGKSDGEEGLNSYHIIYGLPLSQKCLTVVFSAILSHGIRPGSKCKNSYRTVSLNSILCTMFSWTVEAEWDIMKFWSHFGFNSFRPSDAYVRQ